ncbi:MAG: hypothetical protein KGL39_12800 [Patescibacteria group bacterium]|nr:hypothetical protein [Patescibacteria group bacterium]
MARPRGRPPVPLPPIYWRLRIDFEPPEVQIEGKTVRFKETLLAHLLHWQVVIVQQVTADKRETVSIPSHFESDDGEKWRYLQRLDATANEGLHGYAVFRREPPANTKAVVRIRGLEGDPVGEVSMSKIEKVDQQLKEISKQRPEEIAREGVTNPKVLQLIAEHLGSRTTNGTKPPKKSTRAKR